MFASTFRRVCVRVTMILFGSMVAVIASAQTKTTIRLLNPPTASPSFCTYDSLTVNKDGTIEVQCASSSPDSPGVIRFTSSGPTVLDNVGPVTVTVQRSGTTTTSPTTATASLSCQPSSGYLPQFSIALPKTLSFPTEGSQETFTITPAALPANSAPATVTCTLTGATVAQLGTPSVFTLTVNTSSSGGGGESNCVTSPVAQTYSPLNENTRRASIRNLGPGQVAAVRFPARLQTDQGPKSGLDLILTMPIPGLQAPTGWEMAVSECAGDFVNIPPGNNVAQGACGYSDVNLEGVLTMRSAEPFSFFACRLDPAKSYFLNVRWRKPWGESGCPGGSCSAYLDLSYSN